MKNEAYLVVTTRHQNGWDNRLSDDKRKEICRMYFEDGVKAKDIRERLGLTHNQIALALKRFGVPGGMRGWLQSRDTRTCKKCGKDQPIGAFRGANKSTCRKCLVTYVRKFNLARLGFTPELFEKLYREQDGKCALCGRRPKTLCADHDHVSGHARGLLCHRCNQVLGLFEKEEWATAARNYLRRYTN